MDRRTLIKNLGLVLGGAVLLPSCVHKHGTLYVQLKHININSDQQQLIADIAETIIPKTNTPGANELNIPAFVLKMIDDCYNKKGQQTFMTGLTEFTGLVEKKYNRSFSELSVTEREAVLLGIENSGRTKETKVKAQVRNFKPQKNLEQQPLDAFYWAIKQQTLFAYTTSQYFMTKEIVYELIPGRYNAHVPVKNTPAA